ncbi:MAG: radical SAM family heme chaperone HemW [Puniceicoccales bacterium]
MSLQAKPSGPLTPLGLYVHVPFCARACDFCAFYQEAPRRGDIDRYLEGVAREATSMLTGRPVETIFWGGGTPGLLPAEDLRRLGETLLKQLPEPPREWSVEMAPSAVKPDKAAALREIGVNRISMGVQSFDDALLDKLGRQHRANQIYRAWETLREAGFDNINLDLMFALPGQSREQWLADLNEAIRLAPEHISTYCLTFEEDTALWVKLSEGKLRRDVPQEAELYQLSWETLEAAGYAQYEVSNFARPGHACIHNLNTWKMTEWVGLGPSAASQLGGRRFANVANLDQWLAGIEKGVPTRVDEVDLTPSILATDTLIFGLRMNAGVDLAKLEADWPDIDLSAVRPWAQSLVAEGLALLEGDSLRLTPEGRLLADRVGADALDLLEG